jgi:hypothetical protein
MNQSPRPSSSPLPSARKVAHRYLDDAQAAREDFRGDLVIRFKARRFERESEQLSAETASRGDRVGDVVAGAGQHHQAQAAAPEVRGQRLVLACRPFPI